ncbi:DNA polymerase subunit beta [Sulfolobales archaeon HS-7]|nr:DNA polymerase subunit beta [Sulfolobales archaeon HS-7]
MLDLMMDRAKERAEAFNNLLTFLTKIKELVKLLDPEAEVYIFGSVAKGNYRPDSDIDVLVISDTLGIDLKSKVRTVEIVMEAINNRVFEIHVITRNEYEQWYKKFIDVMTQA